MGPSVSQSQKCLLAQDSLSYCNYSSYNKLSELPLEVRAARYTTWNGKEVCGLVDGTEFLGEDKTNPSISPILFTHK